LRTATKSNLSFQRPLFGSPFLFSRASQFGNLYISPGGSRKLAFFFPHPSTFFSFRLEITCPRRSTASRRVFGTFPKQLPPVPRLVFHGNLSPLRINISASFRAVDHLIETRVRPGWLVLWTWWLSGAMSILSYRFLF